MKCISASEKRLIVAYWMSDYCQNGSRSLRKRPAAFFESAVRVDPVEKAG
jgi:hypothetical protein